MRKERMVGGWMGWAGWERESEQGQGRAIFMSCVRSFYEEVEEAEEEQSPHHREGIGLALVSIEIHSLVSPIYYSDCQNAHTRFAFCVPRRALA